MRTNSFNSKTSKFLDKMKEILEVGLILIKVVPKMIQKLIQRIKNRKNKPNKAKKVTEEVKN